VRSVAVGCEVRRTVSVSCGPVRYGWLLYAAAVRVSGCSRLRAILKSVAKATDLYPTIMDRENWLVTGYESWKRGDSNP
jgi:hypothetical protein